MTRRRNTTVEAVVRGSVTSVLSIVSLCQREAGGRDLLECVRPAMSDQLEKQFEVTLTSSLFAFAIQCGCSVDISVVILL